MQALALATILAAATTSATVTPPPEAELPGKVKVFVLAGQSNMEGKGFPEPLAYQVTRPEFRDRYTRFVEGGDFEAFTKTLEASLAEDPARPKYAWSVREDVWVNFLDRRGPLTVGFGVPSKCFGPEYEFGHALGDRFEEPVLIIKTAWGGKSLGRDFLPPSAPHPSDADLERMAEEQNARTREHNEKNPDRPRAMVTPQDIGARYGHFYREMLREVRETLAALPERFPSYAGQGYELAGFVWFQGWNDQFDQGFSSAYGDNLAHLVRDVRRDLEAPGLPVVVGQVGFDGGREAGVRDDGGLTPREEIKRGQASVAELPEFAGTVKVVLTDPFWDMEADAIFRGEGSWGADPERWRQHGNDWPYHYYGSPWFFAQTGRAFGLAMLELLE